MAPKHRARVVSTLLLGLAVGLIAGLGLPAAAAPRPAIILAETDVMPDPTWEMYLSNRDVAVESMQAHEMLYDVLMVWTATAEHGRTCLLTGHARLTGLSLDVCTAGDRAPTFDLVVTDHLRDLFDEQHATGTVLRLVGRDNAVEVFVLEPHDHRSGGPS
ncbi:hypothetical protein HD594_002148 [Microbacterium thalassium]|uniref:Uncharacterized protein n=2 Tax=Microbacterium thalassium TaxID=362649 RepID=A0A7X0FQH2_9MICO|nr:hypothetical protein [Microbacterium thalassium]GLK23854.1 hypothetical protein GCM10017607_11720 [Microbacterium thalassium]